MATYQLALISISDFFPSSEVVTMWQIDSAAYKLKPRLFHKSAHLQVHSVNFHPSVNRAWQAEVSDTTTFFSTFLGSSMGPSPLLSFFSFSLFSTDFTNLYCTLIIVLIFANWAIFWFYASTRVWRNLPTPYYSLTSFWSVFSIVLRTLLYIRFIFFLLVLPHTGIYYYFIGLYSV